MSRRQRRREAWLSDKEEQNGRSRSIGEQEVEEEDTFKITIQERASECEVM